MSESEAKHELWRRYGRGVKVADDIPGEVLVFSHGTQEAAEAYAAANTEHHGHPSRAELREVLGWVCVIDLRPAIALIEAEAS